MPVEGISLRRGYPKESGDFLVENLKQWRKQLQQNKGQAEFCNGFNNGSGYALYRFVELIDRRFGDRLNLGSSQKGNRLIGQEGQQYGKDHNLSKCNESRFHNSSNVNIGAVTFDPEMQIYFILIAQILTRRCSQTALTPIAVLDSSAGRTKICIFH